MKHVTLSKQSKRNQSEHYAKKRGSWENINPITRKTPDKTKYSRTKIRQQFAKEQLPDTLFANFHL